MSSTDATLESHLARAYEHGWATEIDADTIPPGLDEGVIREISRRKQEPE